MDPTRIEHAAIIRGGKLQPSCLHPFSANHSRPSAPHRDKERFVTTIEWARLARGRALAPFRSEKRDGATLATAKRLLEEARDD